MTQYNVNHIYSASLNYTSPMAAMANSSLPALPDPDINLKHSVQYGTQLTETLTSSSLSVSLYLWCFQAHFILYKITQIS